LGQLDFRGTVFSGSGTGKDFVELPWVRAQIEQKLGFTPYPGTLNLRLTKAETVKRRILDPPCGIWVKPEVGYFFGVFFRAIVLDVEAAVVIPLVPSYPVDVLEVVAPLYLRGKLGKGDGDVVVVTVTV
jgi:riboflavin kinase